MIIKNVYFFGFSETSLTLILQATCKTAKT